MKRIKYRCEFKFGNNLMSVITNRGIEAYKSGFWLNENLQFTVGIDAKYWIPPSKIEYIAKDMVNYGC